MNKTIDELLRNVLSAAITMAVILLGAMIVTWVI